MIICGPLIHCYEKLELLLGKKSIAERNNWLGIIIIMVSYGWEGIGLLHKME